MPRICVTVTGTTMAELRQRRDAAAGADLIELRLDGVADPDVAGALAGRRGPVIVTCRPTWEGGRFAGSEEERHALLAGALALGADFVDIEWRAGFDDLIRRSSGKGVVLSMHDFNGVPHDLPARLQAMRSIGVEVVKIAVKTRTLSDTVTLHALGKQEGCQGNLVLVGMGEAGLATRVLPGRFGSRWTYAGEQTTVGQLPLSTLVDQYRVRSATDATVLYGIVGSPVGHSVSPAMHNAAFGAARLDAVYLPFPAADADDFVAFAQALGVRGASVTTPFKVALFDRADEVDATGRHIGAINTIKVVDGRWLGANTDVQGFIEPLGEGGWTRGARASILGAGGAARAVALALGSAGARVMVHARDREKAAAVALLVDGGVGPWPPDVGSWDLLVNCTPIGMHPRIDETPMPADRLTGRLVYDLVYNPPTTRLLREAAAAGCQTIGGLDMLVAQAREQSYWWTDVRPSAAVMREAALRRLAEFECESGVSVP